MPCALHLVALLIGLDGPPAADAVEDVSAPAPVTRCAAERPALSSFVKGAPSCPDDATHCFGLHLHVVLEDGQPVVEPSWLFERVKEANRHFASIDVGFTVTAADDVCAPYAVMATREQRDMIGRGRFTKGVIHLFLVRQLDDVDAPGEQIRGVHWRDRAKTSERWIIMSSIAMKMVLAHELGHFFSLPHGRDPKSLMNKTPRTSPPSHTWTFVAEEREKMSAARDRMLQAGDLVAR
jgi:hypothetical protein